MEVNFASCKNIYTTDKPEIYLGTQWNQFCAFLHETIIQYFTNA